MGHEERLYCEHNRKGLLLWSLCGRFRVYTCHLDHRGSGEWFAGHNEPCVAQCTTRSRNTKGKREYHFPYKRIKWKDIIFSEKAIKQIEEEDEEKRQKAHSLRSNAEGMLIEARKLEESIHS